MNIRAERGKLLALGMFALMALLTLGLLAGCVAANEPASSNEQDRSNDGGEATPPAEVETFTDETADATTTERATIPTHITYSSNGSTMDIRYNIDEKSGQLGTQIVEATGPNAYSQTVTFTYDEQGKMAGGVDEINGVQRPFTTTVSSKQDDQNVEYDLASTYTADPMYDGNNHIIAMVQNRTKLDLEYEIDQHGHAVKLTHTITYSMSDKNYEFDEELTFNEDGLITSCDSSIEEAGASDVDVADSDLLFAYGDDNRTVTRTDKRDDGSDETATFDLAYNEIGQLFRIGGNGAEGTIEYYETPATAVTASMLAIEPSQMLISL